MIEVGRLCIKIAGRDSGKKCVIVDVLDDTFVMIDGETRRRKCNVKHVEPTGETIKLSKGATHQAVTAEFKKMGIELKATKPRQPKPKQIQIRSAERKKLQPKEEPKKAKDSGKPKAEKKSEGEDSALKTKLEQAIQEK